MFSPGRTAKRSLSSRTWRGEDSTGEEEGPVGVEGGWLLLGWRGCVPAARCDFCQWAKLGSRTGAGIGARKLPPRPKISRALEGGTFD